MVDIGALGDPFGASSASAINDAGHVVGAFGHAFLYRNGTMLDLGTLIGTGSGAAAININDLIVGSSLDANGNNRAALWTSDTIYDFESAHSAGQWLGAN